jgi:SAM-dependent methyltransferase
VTGYYTEEYYDTDRPRRYWPGGMDYASWKDLPHHDRVARGMQTYHPPSAQGWHGFREILAMLKQVCRVDSFGSVLDIGCSTGVFLEHVLADGTAACWGIDANRWSIDHPCKPELDGHLYHGVIGRDPMPDDVPERVDLVVAFDLIEHVFECDIDGVLETIRDLADPWVAFCICGTSIGNTSQQWIADKGAYSGRAHLDDNGEPLTWPAQVGAVDIPPERIWQAVSGHVTMMPPTWWWDRIKRAGIAIDYRAMYTFEALRRENRSFCYDLGPATIHPVGGAAYRHPGGMVDQVASWSPRNVVIGRVIR